MSIEDKLLVAEIEARARAIKLFPHLLDVFTAAKVLRDGLATLRPPLSAVSDLINAVDRCTEAMK
jgi:hypothetical protein